MSAKKDTAKKPKSSKEKPQKKSSKENKNDDMILQLTTQRLRRKWSTKPDT